MSTSSNLPQDIITSILSRLPVKSLLRFRCVSKSWCSLIGGSHFAKMHLNQATLNNNTSLMLSHQSKFYSIDYDTSYAEALEINYPDNNLNNWVEIYGSCNGLLFIHTSGINAIWNPCTREFKKVPKAPNAIKVSEKVVGRYVVFGFGYDCTIDDYKAVRVMHSFDGTLSKYFGAQVNVYTLGTNSWRRVDNVDSHILSKQDMDGYILSREESALFVNGTITWLAKVGSLFKEPVAVVSFDVAEEKFCEVPLPECVGGHIPCFGVLGRNLCFVNDLDRTKADLWVMKDYGVKESWTKLFTIPKLTRVHASFRVLCLSNTGEVILCSHRGLLSYNPKLKETKIVRTRGIPEFIRAKPYVGSLVSLKSGTFVGGEPANPKITVSKGEKTRENVPLVQ